MASAKEKMLLTSMLPKQSFVFNIEVGGIKDRGDKSEYDQLTTKTVISIKNLSSYSRLQLLTKENLSNAFLKLYGENYQDLNVEYVVHEKDGKDKEVKSSNELNKIFSLAPPFLNMSAFLHEPAPPQMDVSQSEVFKQTNIS